MHFALTPPLPEGFSRNHYPTKTFGRVSTRSIPEEVVLVGVQPTFELNSLVSQNHQVPTRGKSRYFFFLPFVRQSRSVTIVHSSYVKCVSFQREREREMFGVANFIDLSSNGLLFISYLPYCDQVPSYIPSRKGWRIPNASKGKWKTWEIQSQNFRL